jgi:cell division septation protein DedD
VKITIEMNLTGSDIDDPYETERFEALAKFLNDYSPLETEAPAPAPAPKAEEKPKAKTPPPPPAPKPKAKAADPEPEPEPEPAAEEDDAVARAIALATELVSQKRTADIKSAMESVGATKVSDMTPEQAANFIAAIELL